MTINLNGLTKSASQVLDKTTKDLSGINRLLKKDGIKDKEKNFIHDKLIKLQREMIAMDKLMVGR